jgi:hypothetical protein
MYVCMYDVCVSLACTCEYDATKRDEWCMSGKFTNICHYMYAACMYVCMYVCMYIHIHTYTYT